MKKIKTIEELQKDAVEEKRIIAQRIRECKAFDQEVERVKPEVKKIWRVYQELHDFCVIHSYDQRESVMKALGLITEAEKQAFIDVACKDKE